ncbi:MAG: N-acetylglucosamine-6-phosphate deacetylase [Bacteroidales bacterium]|nr:N-acetylglucosamine-6-phosphate deacetylase [Bacteroidales bacterium]
MKTYIKQIDIYSEKGLIQGGSLLLEDDKIAGIYGETRPGISAKSDLVIDGRGTSAVPGYIDIHVHGGDGHDINDGTADSLRQTRDFYQQHGVTTIFPSYLALPLADIEKALDVLREVRTDNAPGQTEIMGAHLEGPFLNPQYHGSQPVDQIIPIDNTNVGIYERYRDVIARTTIAPEYGHNVDYFPGIAALGIQISMGHSCATIRQAKEGWKKGATSVTHLYNAMSQTHKEGPYRIGGLVEAGLTIDGLYAETICDGYHLPNELLRIAYRCKGVDRMVIVSDACLCAGLPSGSVVRTAGMNFYVEDGISLNEARTSFASSTSPIDKMVRHLIFDTKLPAADVVRMASATPARLMGIYDRKGSIAVGKDADINLVDARFNVVRTFCKGE